MLIQGGVGIVDGKEFSVFFQAEDGIRVAQESRWLGDVYKRQQMDFVFFFSLTKQNQQPPLT